MRSLGFTLPLLACFLTPAAALGQHFPAGEELERMLRYIVEDGEAPGVLLGVLEANGATRVAAHGGVVSGGDLGAGSRFEIGSLTMTFTGALLADMVARGVVDLDDPVSKYLPEGVAVLALSGYEMRLGDLALHRSGLPARPPEPFDVFTVEDLYAFLGEHEPDWVPGRRVEFSYLGYGLLGHALARAAGTTYEALLRERILEPLGLRDTGFDPPTGPEAVRGHDGGNAVPSTRVGEALRGGTGLWSSGADLLTYLEANVGPPETAVERALWTAQTFRYPRRATEGMGFGWSTRSVAGQPPIVYHAARTGGFYAYTAFDPEQRIGTVLLANSRDFGDRIARDLLFFGSAASRPRVRVDPAVLRRYVGTYRAGLGTYRATLSRGKYFIRLEDDGRLSYQAPGVVRTPLFADSDTSFYMLRGAYSLAFRVEGDEARLDLRVDDREPAVAGRGVTAWRVEAETPPAAVAAGNAPFWLAWRPRTWVLLGLGALLGLVAVLRPAWRGWRSREVRSGRSGRSSGRTGGSGGGTTRGPEPAGRAPHDDPVPVAAETPTRPPAPTSSVDPGRGGGGRAPARAAVGGVVGLALVAVGTVVALIVLPGRVLTGRWSPDDGRPAPPAAAADPLNPAVFIERGMFWKGSREPDTVDAGPYVTADEEFGPATVDAFWIQQHEVTNEEYRRFDPSHSYSAGEARRPVTGVTWEEAAAYAASIGGRLPREVEWEFAARGPASRTYPWGDAEPSCERAHYGDCDGSGPLPVMSRPAGATPDGVYDMAGNVWEWVAADWYDPPGLPASRLARRLRGGSFLNAPFFLRAANRNNGFLPGTAGSDIGFRVLWPLERRR